MFWQKLLRGKKLAYSCEEDGKFGGLDSTAESMLLRPKVFYHFKFTSIGLW